MNTNIIEGNPTKSFFIEMITRDISIEDAIIDLLDNSIDGANNINADNYSGKKIELTLNQNEFCIKDNCGGFSLETAQKYAFRFGRPEEAPKVHNTVGRFGIGMKRSLFKIGKYFIVESESETDHFKVEVDVDEWSKKTRMITTDDGQEKIIDDWSFSYQIINSPLGFKGTIIRVTNLNNEVKDLFSDDSFLTQLSEDIQKLLNFSFLKGIQIVLNGRELKGQKIELLFPYNKMPYYVNGKVGDINFRIIAGLGEIGEPERSGWYIYCNNRLVLEADKSNITGWGISPIPKWHMNYVMFRGLLFMDSAETLNLPLTTTKKGVDASSEAYQTILPKIKKAMSIVLDFLKQITKMGDKANEYRRMLCENSDKKTAMELKFLDFQEHPEEKFDEPELDLDAISQKKSIVRIAYDINKNAANAAKLHSEARSYKELGSISFYYYLKMENIDYEEPETC